LSGAAALVYQVVWVRSFGLVFGGSHLAVTTVLSVFMGGLGLGAWLVGRRVDQGARALRLYALLELGIAASALAYVGLMAAFVAESLTSFVMPALEPYISQNSLWPAFWALVAGGSFGTFAIGSLWIRRGLPASIERAPAAMRRERAELTSMDAA